MSQHRQPNLSVQHANFSGMRPHFMPTNLEDKAVGKGPGHYANMPTAGRVAVHLVPADHIIFA